MLRRFAHGAQDVEAFCAAEGVSVASFRRWHRLLRDDEGRTERAPAPKPPFLDLGIFGPGKSEDGGVVPAGRLEVKLELGGGLVL